MSPESQQQNRQRLESWVTRYGVPLRAHLFALVRRNDVADDLLQETFRRAWQAIGRYQEQNNERGWLFRLARNAVIDHVRTHRDHVGLESATERSGGDAGPDEVVAVRQALDEVAAAIEALTEEQREAIALRFSAGLSAREAAAVMGKQEGTVRGLQFRAIAAMRRSLGIDDPEVSVAERPFRPAGDEPMGKSGIG